MSLSLLVAGLLLASHTMLSYFDDPHRRHFALTVTVGVGLAAYVMGSVRTIWGFDLALLLTLVGGYPIYFEALGGLLRGKISAALAVALAALAALWIGQYAVAAEVIFIMLIGEALEHYAINRTRAGIAALLVLRPEEARVRRRHEHHEHSHDHEQVVPVQEIHPDDIVLVRPGDRIPIDGRVILGGSSVDQSPITGESLPADKLVGDEVFAGTINLYGAMELAVERLGEDTTLERIIQLVEEAEAAKAPTEKLADRFATWFVPIVLVVAGLTWWLSGELVRAVSVLVVACPCALVLATPTAVAAGLGAMVRRGVLIKGGTVLESLGRLRTVVFDKTGTLTQARPSIARIVPAEGLSDVDVLRLASAVERNSEHPIGKLIVASAVAAGVELAEVVGFVAHPGLGAQGVVGEATVRVGSPRFLEQAGISLSDARRERLAELAATGATVVLVASDDRVTGAIAVADTIRAEAPGAIRMLRDAGIERIVMLTGDNEAAARTVGSRLGIDDIRAPLLPADKVEAIRQLGGESSPVAMVGDGINDAPSLVVADVGVAMADIGSDVALAAADVVLVGDDLRRLADAIDRGRRMLRIIWQNILGFALVFNVVAVAAASMGWIGPVAAAVLHQISSLAVVCNSLRLLVDLQAWKERIVRVGQIVHRRRRRWLTAAAVAAALVYAASGVYFVQPGCMAVEQRFGQMVRPISMPGLHYRLPTPMGRHQTVQPEAIRRVEVGYRTVEGEFAPPTAEEWNVQHLRGGRERRDAEAEVWTGDENLLDVNMAVHYRVADPVAAVFHVGSDGDGNESKWDILVRDLAEASLREEMARRDIDALLSLDRSEIERALGERIQAYLETYATGFVIESIRLADIHPPLEVVGAFRAVTIEQEGKEEKINEAQAYQIRSEARARGDAYERVATAEWSAERREQQATGSAARFSAVVGAYGEYPNVTRDRLYIETLEKCLAGRRKIILDRNASARRHVWLAPGSPDGLILPPLETYQEDEPR